MAKCETAVAATNEEMAGAVTSPSGGALAYPNGQGGD